MPQECSTSEGTCAADARAEGKGGCPTDALPCPVDMAADCWKASFMRAMCDVQTEMLKKRIQKEWGPQMEKVADAVFETGGTVWQSWVTIAKAKHDLKDRIAAVWSEKGR